MKVISDFHIHSSFSRATSKDITIENLVKYAKQKGLNLLGTGDFTHPKWLEILKMNLKDDGSGILKSSHGFNFILQTEISLIYTHNKKGRRIHLVLLAPTFEVVGQIIDYLKKYGRLDYDGRPIFGIPCTDFVEAMMNISKDIEVIPAHAWTPWFGILGSKSGFDSVEECFGDQKKHIHALETGLSSDPKMNWRLSSLDKYTLVSNSDSHSHWPWRIGREANVFEMEKLTYNDFIKIIREKDSKRFLYTVEFFPEEGKYHFDGHRNCNVCLNPKESMKNRNVCPVCGRPLTIGVLHRVEELADREDGFVPKNAIPFKSLIPLSELIAKCHGFGVASKNVWNIYNRLIENFGSEFNVLLNAEKNKLDKVVDSKLTDVILNVREGKVKMQPGYDGEYGYPLLNGKPKKQKTFVKNKQKSLLDY